ncbi:MAG: TIGR03987 family protein [Candidatus Delongbacteria bacterium]|nr:TIGR03987 family protein [Candidatus Delongbacteria bacterium]
MTSSLINSITLITLALFFYSLGVWAERIASYLKPWHLFAFWIGFSFDVSGTWLMHLISDDSFSLLDLHTFTGQLALWLMLLHAGWASWVIRRGSEEARRGFHRYSLIVWIIWLVPYVGGIFLGMCG